MPSPETAGVRRRFHFPIPFDPFRLLLALLEFLWLILLVAGVCGFLGLAFAWMKWGDSYQANIDLLSEPPANPYASSNPNAPWTPRAIGDEQLLIMARNKQVFEMVSEKMGNGISPNDVSSRVFLMQGGGLSLFTVSANSPNNRREALDLATHYSNAIIEHSSDSRREEAAAEVIVLQSKLDAKKADAEDVNARLLEYSDQENFFDENSQQSAIYNELLAARSELNKAKIALEANHSNMILYLRDSIIVPNQELMQELTQKYRAEHPQVKALSDQIIADEERLNRARQFPERDPLNEFTDGKLTGKIISGIAGLKDQRELHKATISQASARISEIDKEQELLPERVLSVGELKASLSQKLQSVAMIENRLKDAQFYTQTAPPVARIFQTMEEHQVIFRPKNLKAFALAFLAALISGTILSLLLLAREFMRGNVRTPMQAAIATEAIPKIHFPSGKKSEQGAILHDFWLRAFARFMPKGRVFLFPVLGRVRGETVFWNGLFESLTRSEKRIIFMDVSAAPLQLSPGGQAVGEYRYDAPATVSTMSPRAFSPAQVAAQLPPNHLLFIRWDTQPNDSLPNISELVDHHYYLTSPADSKLGDVEYLGSVYQEILGDATGIILVDRKRPGLAKRLVNSIEDWFIDFRQRKALTNHLRGAPL